MRVTKDYCDRCGAEINSRTSLTVKPLKVTVLDRLGFGPFDYRDDAYILCGRCAAKFRKFMSDSDDEE